MSLKVFHIVFIVSADLLAVGLAVWAVIHQKPLLWVVTSILGSLTLNVYLVWFLRKSKTFKAV